MFKKFLRENLAAMDPDIDLDDNITKADLVEIINDLDEDEYYPIMEILLSYIENTFDVDDIDADGTEDIDETELELDEAKYFANRKNQVKRNKKKNKTDKRKLAKKRKMAYKKNKAKAKRYRKKAARKKKSGKTVGGKRLTKHR